MIKTVDLKKNEVCIVLPCQIGDTISISRDSISGISERTGIVQKFEISASNILMKTTLGMFNARELGHSIFLVEKSEKQEELEERE